MWHNLGLAIFSTSFRVALRPKKSLTKVKIKQKMKTTESFVDDPLGKVERWHKATLKELPRLLYGRAVQMSAHKSAPKQKVSKRPKSHKSQFAPSRMHFETFKHKISELFLGQKFVSLILFFHRKSNRKFSAENLSFSQSFTSFVELSKTLFLLKRFPTAPNKLAMLFKWKSFCN